MKPTQKDVRHYTNMLLEMIDGGRVDKDMVIIAFCCYLSEDDIYDMMQKNELLESLCTECDTTEELNEAGLCEDCAIAIEQSESCHNCNDTVKLNGDDLCEKCVDEERWWIN